MLFIFIIFEGEFKHFLSNIGHFCPPNHFDNFHIKYVQSVNVLVFLICQKLYEIGIQHYIIDDHKRSFSATIYFHVKVRSHPMFL